MSELSKKGVNANYMKKNEQVPIIFGGKPKTEREVLSSSCGLAHGAICDLCVHISQNQYQLKEGTFNELRNLIDLYCLFKERYLKCENQEDQTD